MLPVTDYLIFRSGAGTSALPSNQPLPPGAADMFALEYCLSPSYPPAPTSKYQISPSALTPQAVHKLLLRRVGLAPH
jgi:hypothetical protein